MKMEKTDVNTTTLKVEDIKGKPLKNVTIVNVREIKTEYGPKKVMDFKASGKDYSVFLNAISINALIDAFGDESDKWKGKSANVEVYNGKETKNSDAIVVRKA